MFEKLGIEKVELKKKIKRLSLHKKYKNINSETAFLNLMKDCNQHMKKMGIPVHARIYYIHDYCDWIIKTPWGELLDENDLNIDSYSQEIKSKFGYVDLCYSFTDTTLDSKFILYHIYLWYEKEYLNFGYDSFFHTNTILFPLLHNEEELIDIKVVLTSIPFHSQHNITFSMSILNKERIRNALKSTDIIYLEKYVHMINRIALSPGCESMNSLLLNILKDYDSSSYSIMKGNYSYSAWDSLQAVEKILKLCILNQGVSEKYIKEKIGHVIYNVIKCFNQNHIIKIDSEMFSDFNNINTSLRYNKKNMSLSEAMKLNYLVLNLMKIMVNKEDKIFNIQKKVCLILK